jgi:putative Ca2+/H+ antiporter (TMEM165/GDT1 family)
VEAAAVAFGVVFIAEIGDKTEIVTLALVARFGAPSVLTGVALASLVVNAAAVAAGNVIAESVPTSVVAVTAGLVFLGFAAWEWRSPDDPRQVDVSSARSFSHAVLITSGTFLLTELGDKTMFATAALATRGSPIAVWLGATAGVVAADSIAVLVGKSLRDHLQPRRLRIVTTVVFALVGTILIVDGLLA